MERAKAQRTTITDPRVMRALAHPARLAILDHLGATTTGVTATEAAEVVGLSPSATSYHLRELAKHGLIEEAPGRGDGRERVWQARLGGFSVEAGRSADPEQAAAERALIDVFLARDDEHIRQWLSGLPEEPEEWYKAAGIFEMRLLVTAEELIALNEAVEKLVEPYRDRNRRDGAPDGARLVATQYRAIPLP